MSFPLRYDLLVILGGDKPARHPVALELFRRGWARYITVTGEQEWIDPTPELGSSILFSPTSNSTYEDALAARILMQQHNFATLLVVTAAYQADRARLTFRRALADLPVTVDIMSWECTNRPPRAWRVLRRQLAELCKLGYYLTRRRA